MYRTLSFKSAKTAYWKLLVANESLKVSKGEIFRVNVEKIRLPPNTVVSPLAIKRHYAGIVVDVEEDRPEKIDGERNVDFVYFLATRDGDIEKGDLLGVVKVYPIKTAPAEMIGKVEAPDVNIRMERKSVKMATESGRKESVVEEMWYRRWNVAEWFPIIADEDKEVEKGKIEEVRIKMIELPPNTIPVPLHIMRNAYGTILDLEATSLKKVEERNLINKVYFLPVFPGEIRRGDLLGVLNIYYISVGERSAQLLRYLTEKVRARMTYWVDEWKVESKEIEIEPLSFKRSPIGLIEPIYAAESKKLKKGVPEVVKMEMLEFPSGTIIQPISGKSRHPALLVDVMSFEPPKLVEEDKKITHAVIYPAEDVDIRKGDYLGMIIVYNVSVLMEPYFFLKRHELRGST